MQFSVDRTEAADAAAWVAQALPKRPERPELAGARITAADGYVTFAGYDLETSHTARVPAEVVEPGAVLVAGRMLAPILAALRGASVTMTADAGRLVIRAGRATYRLNGMILADWPEPPGEVPPADHADAIEADELRRIVALVAYAADDNNPTERLRGLRLYGDAEVGTLTALAGKPATVGAAWADWPGGSLFAHVPVARLVAALRGLDGFLVIAADASILSLDDGTRRVTQRLYQSKPLGWHALVPDDCPIRATLDVGELREAVNRAALTCRTLEPIRFRLLDDALTINAGAADNATGVEVVDVVTSGEVVVDFGAETLVDALAALPDGPITFAAKAPGMPCKIVDPSDRFVVVLMPRRAEPPADGRHVYGSQLPLPVAIAGAS